MHQSERDRLYNEIVRLRFAEADMRMAAAAADALAGEQLNGELCRALETALVVCYARPFDGRNKIGKLDTEKWVPIDPRYRVLHNDLLRLRDQLYAHSDRTALRRIVDFGDILGEEHRGHWTEQWTPINSDFLPGFAALCRWQAGRFRDEGNALAERLLAAAKESSGPR